MPVYKVQAEGTDIGAAVYRADVDVRDSESVVPLLGAVDAVKAHLQGEKIIIGIPCVTSVSDASSVVGMQGESFDQGISTDFNLQHGGKKNILNQVINGGLAGVKLCLLPCAAVKACEQGGCIVYSATDLGTEKSVEPLQTFITQCEEASADVHVVLEWSGQYDFFPFALDGTGAPSTDEGSAVRNSAVGGGAFAAAEGAITARNWNAENCQPMLEYIETCRVRIEQLLEDVPELDLPKDNFALPDSDPYATAGLTQSRNDMMCNDGCFSCLPS